MAAIIGSSSELVKFRGPLILEGRVLHLDLATEPDVVGDALGQFVRFVFLQQVEFGRALSADGQPEQHGTTKPDTEGAAGADRVELVAADAEQ
jgi:hypothetical protein